MGTLADIGSTNMYRKRLGQWGLAKNLRRVEVVDLLKGQSHKGCPDTVSDHSDKLTHAPQFQPERVKQYLRRNKKVMELLARMESIPRFGQAPAGQLQDSEVLLRRLSTYIDSYISTGSWTLGPDGRCQSRHGGQGEAILLEAWGRFDTVIRFTSRSEDVELFRILDPAFQGLQKVTVEETPRAFSFISSALLSLQRYGRSDLIRVTLDHLCRTSRELLGPDHQLTRIWETVSKLHHEDGALVGAMEVVFDALLNELAARLGNSNPFLASVCTDYFDAVICTKSESEKDVFLRRVLTDIDVDQAPELQVRHHVTQRNLKCLAGEFEEAFEVGMLSSQNRLFTIWRCQLWRYVRRKQGRLHSAKFWFERAFNNVADEVLAFSDEHWVQPILINLEDVARELGFNIEEEQYRRIRRERIMRLVHGMSEPRPASQPIRRYDPFENDVEYMGC